MKGWILETRWMSRLLGLLGLYVKKSDIVDNLTSGGTTVPLSAEMGKTLNDKLTWKLLVDKSDTSAIAYPSDWNELWVIATAENTYGWSTVSAVIPKAYSDGGYITVVGRNNLVLTVYKGASFISIEGNASQNVNKWKAYYR